MQWGGINAGVSDYVCAGMCLNILKVDFGRNELPDCCVRASVCVYIYIYTRV